MASGDLYVDGVRAPGMTGKEMCEYVVKAGLFSGTPEELWNLSPTGELSQVFDLYYAALAKNGHKIEVEAPDGTRVPYC